MFYEVEWIEGGIQRHRCVFKAMKLSILTKSLRYMNWERYDTKAPRMEKIQITELKGYYGEYVEVTGNYQPGLSVELKKSLESRELL